MLIGRIAEQEMLREALRKDQSMGYAVPNYGNVYSCSMTEFLFSK